MDIKDYLLDKTGDYDAFRVDIYSNGKLQLSVIRKISGTELASSIANGIVKNRDDALKKLRAFTVSEATTKFNKGEFKVGEVYEDFFSPNWPQKII